MRIGLIDVDGHRWPNLPLMKISAYHKAHGDDVEFYQPLSGLINQYDKVYMSKVFTFTQDYASPVYAKEIAMGGTGYGMTATLPAEVEDMYPDYNLYGVSNTAYGFLTRGCPRRCEFCVVSEKEGCVSRKVANLDRFWCGQREIKLLDPNLLACTERVDLLEQLADSGAWVDFTQGLDIRLMTPEMAEMIMRCMVKMIHFAWDGEQDSEIICRKLKEFKAQTKIDERKARVYVLTNFNTPFEFDLYRCYELQSMGFDPYVMIYNKQTAPKKTKELGRWVNSKYIFRSCPRFEDYRPGLGGIL